MNAPGNGGVAAQEPNRKWQLARLVFVVMLVASVVLLLAIFLSFFSWGETAVNWLVFWSADLPRVGLGIAFGITFAVAVALAMPVLRKLFVIRQVTSAQPVSELYIVGGKNLEQLEQLSRHKQLHKLHIVRNESLASLPDAIGKLGQLQVLYVVGNVSLTGLPAGVGRLKSLHDLCIVGNTSLTGLPAGLGQLAGLRELHIVGNEAVSALPESMGQLAGLRKLYLDCDLLLAHSQAIAGLANLEELHVVYGEREKLADVGAMPPNAKVSQVSYQEYYRWFYN